MSRADRTQVHRAPHKQRHDEKLVQELLSRAILAHVAIVDNGDPICLPVACAPFGNELLLHGSTASRLFKLLANGASACVTITHLDGLVLARSAFDSSMHYQSLMAFGLARSLNGEEKVTALDALTDHLFPERRSELPLSTEKEIAATSVLAFPLNEISLKVSENPPEPSCDGASNNPWIGTLPILSSYGVPVPIPSQKPEISTPNYISRWPINRI